MSIFFVFFYLLGSLFSIFGLLALKSLVNQKKGKFKVFYYLLLSVFFLTLPYSLKQLDSTTLNAVLMIMDAASYLIGLLMGILSALIFRHDVEHYPNRYEHKKAICTGFKLAVISALMIAYPSLTTVGSGDYIRYKIAIDLEDYAYKNSKKILDVK